MILRLEYMAHAQALLGKEVARLHPYLQLLFFRLYFMCDGAGRFKADAADIRAGLYAHELQKVSERDVASRLHELHRAGLIKLYTEGEVGFGKVTERFWLQRDGKRKVRHPDEPSEQPDLLPLVASPVVEKKISNGGGGRKKIPSPSIQFSSEPPASLTLEGLQKLHPHLDVEAEARAAERRQRKVHGADYQLDLLWFAEHWLAKAGPKLVRGKAAPTDPEPPGWRAALDALRPGHTYEGTFAALPADLRAEIQNHGRAA